MDISQHLQNQQQITFHTDASGKVQDYPCTVKKIKKNLIAIVLDSKLEDSSVCALGTKIILKWTTDNMPYSLLTKIAQNKTFPLVILNKQAEINEQADQKPPSSAAAPAAIPPAPLAAAPPKATAEKPKDDIASSYYSYAEKKSIDLETFDYIRDLINEVPQLYSLGPDEVISLVPYLSYKSAEKGTLIFKEGDAGDSLFYIAKGAVDIVKESVKGNPIKLVQFTQDSMLGEMALIDSAPRSATAKVFDDVELIILSRESFEGLLKDVPAIGIKIFKQIATTMGQRVRFANGRLADVLDQVHQQRIALEDEEKK
ncbi:MAG: cyclic nucleotide-binding domain-containing protein [Nitrospinota bacterium]